MTVFPISIPSWYFCLDQKLGEEMHLKGGCLYISGYVLPQEGWATTDKSLPQDPVDGIHQQSWSFIVRVLIWRCDHSLGSVNSQLWIHVPLLLSFFLRQNQSSGAFGKATGGGNCAYGGRMLLRKGATTEKVLFHDPTRCISLIDRTHNIPCFPALSKWNGGERQFFKQSGLKPCI